MLKGLLVVICTMHIGRIEYHCPPCASRGPGYQRAIGLDGELPHQVMCLVRVRRYMGIERGSASGSV